MEKVMTLIFPDGRYKQIGNYKVDRLIVNIAFMLWGVFSIVAVVLAHPQLTSDLDYFSCSGDIFNPCDNPFYTPTTWRNSPTLIGGEYGNPNAPNLVNGYTLITLAVFGIAGVINHAKNNAKIQNKKRRKRL